MKILRLTVGIVSIFLMFNALSFAQDPLSFKDNYRIMPLAPSSGIFTTPQEAVQDLTLAVGEAKVELNRKDVKLLSEEKNKVTLELLDTKEKILLSYTENSIVIEYGGTTLTIDSNVAIGKIVVDGNGVRVYDKNNKLIAWINKAGGGAALIDGMYVTFDKGTKVTLKGGGNVDMALDVNGDGKVDMADVDAFKGKMGSKAGDANWDPKFDLNGDGVITLGGDVLKYREAFANKGKVSAIEVETEAGSYIIEKTTEGNIKITSPGGDTFIYNTGDSHFKLISIKADGSATLHLWASDKGLVEVKFDSQGQATTVTLYGENLSDKHTISLAREEGVKLNLTLDKVFDVTISSDAENSVKLKFKQDGSVEVTKPDGTVVPITGDIQKATFNKDGGLTINFKDGSIITINPGENPNPDDGGWWDGMTNEEIISTLQNLVNQGNLEEAAQKFSEIAGADLDLASQVMQGMQTTTAANIVNKLDLNLAVQVLQKLDSQKIAEILTAVDSGDPNYDARLDLNGDGVINLADAALFIGKIGAKEGDPNYDARLDLNGDGVITVTGDVLMLRGHIGASRGSDAPIISANKAGEILAVMDKGKAAGVLSAIKVQDAVPIVKAMLNKQGAQTVAGIMKLMDPAKVAAIMAIPNGQWWMPGNSSEGLTINECVYILRAMGGIRDRQVGAILSNLYQLNPYKALMVAIRLWGVHLPIIRPGKTKTNISTAPFYR